MRKGEQYCKLTNAQIRGMRSLYGQGYTINELCGIYKVTNSFVRKVVKMQTRQDA